MNETWSFIGVILLLIIITIVLSVILIKTFKQHKLATIIPSILFFILSIFLFIKAHFFTTPTKDLAYFIMSVICLLATLITLIINLLISKFNKNTNHND